MAVRFHIDLNAIADGIDSLRNAGGAPNREARDGLLKQLGDLVLFWECHGILCTGGLTRIQLIDQIDAFPEKQKSAIQALSRGLRNRANGRSHLRILEGSIPNHIGCCQLSVILDTEGEQDGTATVSLSGFLQAQIVREAWEEDDWVIPIGCRPEIIWQKCFNSYAESAKKVAIVDPYIMQDNGSPQTIANVFLRVIG